MTDEYEQEIQSMLKRFERVIDLSEVKDPDDIIKKFEYFQNRKSSFKQQALLRKYSEQKGIGVKIEKPRPIGISKRKGKPRDELKRHYTTHKVRGKTRMVARISKGMKGAGRFATRG